MGCFLPRGNVRGEDSIPNLFESSPGKLENSDILKQHEFLDLDSCVPSRGTFHDIILPHESNPSIEESHGLLSSRIQSQKSPRLFLFRPFVGGKNWHSLSKNSDWKTTRVSSIFRLILQQANIVIYWYIVISLCFFF